MVRQLVMTQAQLSIATTIVYGICSLNTNPTDSYLTVQEDEPIPQAYATSILPNKS